MSNETRSPQAPDEPNQIKPFVVRISEYLIGCLAFLTFGIMLGLMIGMTSESVVSAFLPLAFTLFGGSLLIFLNTVSATLRPLALWIVFSLSLGIISGVLSGIWISENRVLSPTADRSAKPAVVTCATETADRKYLRNFTTSDLDIIIQKVDGGVITKEEAYIKILDLVKEQHEN